MCIVSSEIAFQEMLAAQIFSVELSCKIIAAASLHISCPYHTNVKERIVLQLQQNCSSVASTGMAGSEVRTEIPEENISFIFGIKINRPRNQHEVGSKNSELNCNFSSSSTNSSNENSNSDYTTHNEVITFGKQIRY
jgi:hypothetical protein